MQIVTQSISFGPLAGSGPQIQTANVTFPTSVTQATAILMGFTAQFSGGDDHHLGRLQVQLAVTSVSDANVTVNVQFGLRDWSGDWDDQYDGQVNFAVVAEWQRRTATCSV